MIKRTNKSGAIASALESNEARRSILRAAGRSFAKSGLAGARTDAIAADAGVNKALLYYYFKSKEDIFKAVIEGYFAEFNRLALETLNAPGRAQDVLLEYVTLHIDFIAGHHQSAPLFQQVMMTDAKFGTRIVRKYFAERAAAMDRLLKRGIRDGEFRRVDRFQAAVSIVSLIVFYFSASKVLKSLGRRGAYRKEVLKQRKRQVVDFIRHGLFAGAKGGRS